MTEMEAEHHTVDGGAETGSVIMPSVTVSAPAWRFFACKKKRSMFTVETGHEAAVAGPEKHFAAFSDPAP